MGIPLEVMGIMLGKFIDKLNVEVKDVFAMPQTGSKVSVEAVDPIFQTKMLEMLLQIGKYNIIVGWYHSHPGFGCWLSGVDINTQKSFEQLNRRSIALVVDPIQSTRGNVVIEIFRLRVSVGQNLENRELTSLELGFNDLPKYDDEFGINKNYYSLNFAVKKNLLEEMFLSKIFEKAWNINLFVSEYSAHFSIGRIKVMSKIFKNFLNIIAGPFIFSNNWSQKNMIKIKKLKNEIKDFFEIISKESIFFCLSEIIKKEFMKNQ